jgi:hypothetical protein
MSPSSDIVGPSPVTSNGTDTTEIDDELGSEHAEEERTNGHPSVCSSCAHAHFRPFADPFQLMMLRTNLPDSIRKSMSEEVISVIHAPQSFQSWVRPVPWIVKLATN